MRADDPDEQPTRAGGKSPDDRAEERTVPSLDGKGGKDAGKGKDGSKSPGSGGAAPADQGKPGAAKAAGGPQPGTGGPSAGKPAAGKPAAAHPADAPRPAASNDPLLGKDLGGCRLEKLLGRGAMGAVYKARQRKLDRDVAVKIIRPEMMTDPRMLKRFEVEARTVGKFNSAHVVMVHDVGFELGVHYLVMEFVEGKNLRDHVKLLAGGRLPAGEALPLLRQAIRGLEEAQRLQVVHRDIKPDNLMLTDRGVLKIADFGIAKPLQEDFSMTLTSELVGTPLYMSPEQCQGEASLDFRSDMYSLGATFYYLLTGEPPIRASSVYELIQTKTKMASLCLWKALPGLDENNPLSRVVERMTALDREDRYDSYEALLNDLVLVEQGQTIQVPKPSGGKTRRAAAAGSRRGVWIAAAAVLAAGGGFAAYQLSKPPAVVVGPNVDVAARLAQLRASCKEGGPTAAIAAELRGLPSSFERDQLLGDVEEGMRIKSKLDGIVVPKNLALPFAELELHFDKVDAAALTSRATGPEVRTWFTRWRDSARAEDQLGALASKELTLAFARWLDDRSKCAGDQQELAALGERLTVIEEARRVLLDRLPSLRDQVQQDLPTDRLDTARRDLKGNGMVRPVEVDASTALAAIAAEFAATGPEAALEQRLKELQPTVTAQVQQRDALLNALRKAETQRELVLGAKVRFAGQRPVAPFADVRQYFDSIDAALSALRENGELPAWAQALREQARDEQRLCDAVVGVCAAAFAQWQQAPDGPTTLDALRTMRQRGIELFPSAKDRFDTAVPEAALAQREAVVQRDAGRTAWLGDARAFESQLGNLAKLSEWRAAAARTAERLAAVEKASAAFADDPDVASLLQRLRETCGRWRAADATLQTMAKEFGQAKLSQVESALTVGLSGHEGAQELEAIGTAVRACRDAFDGLATRLDIAAAKTSLAKARTTVQGLAGVLPEIDTRVRKWSEGLDALQRATAGMVPIPAGRLNTPAAAVDAFFLAANECSRAEFVQFQTELKAALQGIDDAQKRFAAVADRLAGAGLNADRLRQLLDFEPTGGERAPVHRVTWYAAAAYAAWYGRQLPRPEEWALAAFGDNNANEFPWGAGWATSNDKRNIRSDVADVDNGGNSWRGGNLHHLAGNVAEWLAADPAAREAQLAGGRFSDAEGSAKEQARGKLIPAAKDDGQRGFGFRTVLRPRSFAPLQWPQ
ncbi:MAG: protein kinase [Planctomycetes bacterium]|nr:protein kinase [Planctomycetota bacterium]